jgi:hypothetical protein
VSKFSFSILKSLAFFIFGYEDLPNRNLADIAMHSSLMSHQHV